MFNPITLHETDRARPTALGSLAVFLDMRRPASTRFTYSAYKGRPAARPAEPPKAPAPPKPAQQPAPAAPEPAGPTSPEPAKKGR